MNKNCRKTFFKMTGNSIGVKKQILLSKIFVDLGLNNVGHTSAQEVSPNTSFK